MASFNLKRFISNPIKGFENAGRSLGKVEMAAAPYLGLIPGVGPGIGALTGAHGSILAGKNRASHLKTAAIGGLSGFANSKLLGGKGVLGVKDALSTAAGKISGAIAHPGSVAGSIPGAITSAAGGLVSGAAKNGFGWKDLLGLGVAGYGAYTGVKQSNRDQTQIYALTGKQLGIADEVANRGRSLNATADTLRDPSAQALLARVQRGPRPVTDFSRFNDQSNPFAKQYTAPAAPPPAGAAPPMPRPALAPPLAPPGWPSPASGGSNRTGTIMGLAGQLAGASAAPSAPPNQDLPALPLGALRKRLFAGAGGPARPMMAAV